ncbi:MAG: glycoside hydrolase family 10 protein [Cyanobacteriota bacterium]|nr:glycoside hydrolase family 10 protein [Cyanobacteriota bacterium]
MQWRVMFRRGWRSLKFLVLTLLFVLTAVSATTFHIPATAARSAEIRGVWVTSNDTKVFMDSANLKEALNQLSRLNFNTIYPVVWNSGYVLYESAVAQRNGIQPFIPTGFQGQDTLAETIAYAHRDGMLVVPWFEFGFMAPRLSELTLTHPNWLTQRADGSKAWVGAAGEVFWLNPFHPEVQQFMIDLVLEAIARYDVDGIQFDDHLSLPNEFGYDPYTVALYKKETKKDPPKDFQNPEWVRWRADKITDFVKRLRGAIAQRKPKAIFSISPNPYSTAYNRHLQDWLTWVREDLVDELIVQVYRHDLQSFTRELNRPEIKETKQKIPTGIGVLTGLRNRPVPISYIQSKVWEARDRGLGVSFFYYESLWDDAPESIDVRQSGFRRLFPSPAFR